MNVLVKGTVAVLAGLIVLFAVYSLGVDAGADPSTARAPETIRKSTAPVVSVATPEPTAEPTAEPTPEPTVEPPLDTDSGFAGTLAWLSYSEDRLSFMNKLSDALDEWVVGDDPSVAAMGAVPVWSLYLQEKGDLEFADVHPCFAPWHAEYSAMISEMEHGYDLLTDGGIYDDSAMMIEGMSIIDAANAEMDTLMPTLETTATTCRES